MALADTSKAIGAVSRALKQRITFLSGVNVAVGRPSTPGTTYPQVNLFLYEIAFDPHLKNTSLTEPGKPPLWVVLKYLLTVFAADDESDSDKAHDSLGAVLRAVYTDDLLSLALLSTPELKALGPNPSPLHVTFDDGPTDLMAKLMQGHEEKLRLSACFQVRPVMIAPSEPPDLSLLVGVDYTKSPAVPANPYVGVDVRPSMGPHIDSISPGGFEVDEEVTLRGTDLHLANLSVMLGPIELPVIMQQPDRLRFRVNAAGIAAGGLSAGSHAVTVVQMLPGTGKKRKSNAVIGNLVPTLDGVTVGAAVMDDPGPPITSHRDIDLSGKLLGLDTDDTILAFYRDGAVVRAFDIFAVPSPATQLTRQIVVSSADGLPAGAYRAILIVNGQQAPQSPEITLSWL